MSNSFNSSCISWIEAKHNHVQNFNSSPHAHFFTKINSKHINMLSITRSTRLSQEIGKRKRSNSTYLELQWSKLVSLDAMELQIHSSMRALKLDARISNWKHSNPTQFSSSIFMFMLMNLLESCSIPTNNGWSLLRIPWGWRIYKNLEELCEEKWNLKWEKNWRENEFSDLKLLLWQMQLWLGLYMVH